MEASDTDNADGNLSILRISHSDVVPEWRGRQRRLIDLGASVCTVVAKHWSEGGKKVEAGDGVSSREGKLVPAQTIGQHPILFLYSPRVLWEMLRVHWDVVDIHEEPYSLVALEIRLIMRLVGNHAPTILYSAQNIERRLPLLFRFIEKWQIVHTVAFSVCNEESRSRLIRRGAAADQIHVIGLGYSGDRFHPIRRASYHEDGRGERRIGYVGRLQRSAKGIEILFEAFSIANVGRAVTLHLYGGGEDAEYLQELAKRSTASDRIFFHGPIPNEAVPDVYAELDVAVVPSIDTETWKEQFGRSAVEAIACGVPTVVSDTAALREVCEDMATIVPQRNSSALAGALIKALSLPRNQYVSRMRDKFEWSAIGDCYAKLYKSVAEVK